MKNNVRVITTFNKADESYLGEFRLNEFNLSEVQRIFNVPKENPMFDCWEITEESSDYFKRKFDFKNHIYYIEAYYEEI